MKYKGTTTIKRAHELLFKKEGIEIPFPQRDLNIKGDSNFNIKKRV